MRPNQLPYKVNYMDFLQHMYISTTMNSQPSSKVHSTLYKHQIYIFNAYNSLSIDRSTYLINQNEWTSNFILTPVWGFKQSNTDFICAVGRCVKFIDPINISQISVYTNKLADLFITIHLFTFTLKIIFLTIKHFISTYEFLFNSFTQ